MSTHIRSVLISLFLFAAGLLGSAFAGPPLMLPVNTGALPGNAMNTPAPSRSQAFRVHFNKQAAREMRVGEEADLPMPNGRRYAVIFDQFIDHGNDMFSWVGYLKDSPRRQRVIITTGSGGSFGRISTPEGDFRMAPGPGHDWLVDMRAEAPYLDPIELGQDVKFAPPNAKQFRKASTINSPDYYTAVPGLNASLTTKNHQTNVFVDLMMVYTSGLAANLGGNLMTRINNWVTAANMAYVDSHVHITLRLVHTVQVNYPDSGVGYDTDNALDAISPFDTGGTGVFANIESLRSTHGADMVAFWRNGPNLGGNGIAWAPQQPITPANAQNLDHLMYSVTTGCVLGCDFVMIHELGHNMGNMHDRYTVAWQSGGRSFSDPLFGRGSTMYAYGYAACASGSLICNPQLPPHLGGCAANQQPECTSGKWCSGQGAVNNYSDIMAYFQCSRYLEPTQFSNPDISCTGDLGSPAICGIYSGNSEAANAAQSMNENAAGLSAMRAAATPTANVALASSVNPSVVGQSVTFTAAVAGSSGTPTGTVNFRDNGASLAGCSAVALSGSGVATCSSSVLAQGTHPITAVYSGNGTYGSTTSSTVNQVVTKLTPTVTTLSSHNPSASGESITLTTTVMGTGGTPTGNVIFYNGASTIAGCTSVALNGSGMATCSTSALPAGTRTLYGAYQGNATYNAISSNSVNQIVQAASITNVASAANGASATASSNYGGPLSSIAATIDGVRTGQNWGSGGGWEDGTQDVYPDWLQVNFNGFKLIDRIVVYTLRDNLGASEEPTDTLTFSSYGIYNFSVQGWDGGSWVTLGTAMANTLVKRTFVFTPFATDRIRVLVTHAIGFGKTRIVEVEAWGSATSGFQATNVALAANGAVASVSSNYGTPFSQPGALNDGHRSGFTWGAGGGWEDGTFGAYPDHAQIDFNGMKKIDRVVVYTLRDDFGGVVADPLDTTQFTLYGLRDFTVQAWNGSSWVVVGTVIGNNMVKRTVAIPPTVTDKIRINVTSGAYFKSRVVEIEAFGVAAVNVARDANGAVATASSDYGAPHSLVAATVDGARTGQSWGAGAGWEDSTPNGYPDWLQVQFSGSKTIDKVVLYTLRDGFGTSAEPTDALTFSSYGITDFQVQGWTGAAWTTLATVTGNNLVKRTVTFPPYATERIRILVNNALYYSSRIVEVEAYEAPPINVALASKGAVATASSTYPGPFASVAAVNNDERAGMLFGSGGGWVDNNYGAFPDFVDINFDGSRTISRIVVYTLRDDFGTNQSDPHDATTFTSYGIRDFTVQTRNGGSYDIRGTATNNNLVKRTFDFSPVTTDRIRVSVTGAQDGNSRIIEVEAWGR